MIKNLSEYLALVYSEFPDVDSDDLREIVDTVVKAIKADLELYCFAVSDTSEYTEHLTCGCELSLELDDFDELDGSRPRLDINYCEEHASANEYKEELRKLAHKLWLEDAEARFKPETRDLLKLVGI